MRPLTPVEARVLAVLVEKEKTVPETYPMSPNALLAGCNQKSSRDPVMQCTEADVASALDGLRSLSLVTESSGAKVMRYGHNVERAMRLPALSVVLLAVLMLRGEQTAAELRMRAERLHRFADVSSVEGFLDELASRSGEAGGPLVRPLPRRPGEREVRWTHLLCATEPAHGDGATFHADVANTGRREPSVHDEPQDVAGPRIERLEEQVRALTVELARLTRVVDALAAGVSGGPAAAIDDGAVQADDS